MFFAKWEAHVVPECPRRSGNASLIPDGGRMEWLSVCSPRAHSPGSTHRRSKSWHPPHCREAATFSVAGQNQGLWNSKCTPEDNDSSAASVSAKTMLVGGQVSAGLSMKLFTALLMSALASATITRGWAI